MLPNPYDPQALNRYSYVKNNPLKYTDPSGNVFFIPPAIAFFASAYSTTLVADPGTQFDAQMLSYSAGDFLNNPSLGNGAALGLDLAGFAAPALPASGTIGKAILKHTGVFTGRQMKSLFSMATNSDPTRALNNIADIARYHGEGYQLMKNASYRSSFEQSLRGISVSGLDVDHRIPEFVSKNNPKGVRAALDKLGTNDINDPRLLQAIDKTVNRGALNSAWQGFVENNPNASGQEIIDQMNNLGNQYQGVRVPGAF